jgi:hypothetical protein
MQVLFLNQMKDLSSYLLDYFFITKKSDGIRNSISHENIV